MQVKRNAYDEQLLKLIGKLNAEFTPKNGMHCLLVGDARPQLNAYTNKVGGWGYEEASVCVSAAREQSWLEFLCRSSRWHVVTACR